MKAIVWSKDVIRLEEGDVWVDVENGDNIDKYILALKAARQISSGENMYSIPIRPMRFTVTLNNDKQHHFLLLDGMIEFLVKNTAEQTVPPPAFSARLRARFGMRLVRLGLSLIQNGGE